MTAAAPAKKKYGRRLTNRASKVGMTHIEAKRPAAVDLGDADRLTAANVMWMLGGMSQTRFYARQKSPDPRLRIPAPDGYDGRRPYWLVGTVRAWLASGGTAVRDAMAR